MGCPLREAVFGMLVVVWVVVCGLGAMSEARCGEARVRDVSAWSSWVAATTRGSRSRRRDSAHTYRHAHRHTHKHRTHEAAHARCQTS